jgi:hypothetical protein
MGVADEARRRRVAIDKNGMAGLTGIYKALEKGYARNRVIEISVNITITYGQRRLYIRGHDNIEVTST